MKLYICSASSEADVLWIDKDISQRLGLSSAFLCKASDITEAAECIVYSETTVSCGGTEVVLIPGRNTKCWSRVCVCYWASVLFVVSHLLLLLLF